MYNLKDILTKIAGIPEHKIVSDSIFCMPIDKKQTLLTNSFKEFFDGFTFSLIKNGRVVMMENGNKVVLNPNDIYIYSPGKKLKVIEASDNLTGLRLAIEKSGMFDSHVSRNIIKAVNYPMINFQNKIPLDKKNFTVLYQIMTAIIYHQESDIKLKKEASFTLFTLFLINFIDYLEKSGRTHKTSLRTEGIVVDFMKLIQENFNRERNISFYAKKLNISPVYLSRLVKQNTGKTVIHHIDDLIASQASWLLKFTDMSIKEMAEEFNFADQASFNKFFIRKKGLSPTDFRKTNITQQS